MRSFRCKECGFTLHADLNASRNIGVLGKAEYLRLCANVNGNVNQPIVAPDEPMPTGVVDGSYKPFPLGRGS